MTGQKCNRHKLKYRKYHVSIGKKKCFYSVSSQTMEQGVHKVMESPSAEIFKT